MTQAESTGDPTPPAPRDPTFVLSLPFVVLFLAQLAVVPWRSGLEVAPLVYAPVWSHPFYAFPADLERMQGMTLGGPHAIHWTLLLIQLLVTVIAWGVWLAWIRKRARAGT